MTSRQEAFVAHYLETLNATESARRAGYSTRTADRIGPRLLGNVAVRAAIQAGKSRQLAAVDLSAQRTLEELRRILFFDVRTLFDANGNLKPVSEWTDEQGAVIQSLEVVKKNLNAGDGFVDTVHKVRLVPKQAALDLAMKHFGLARERIEHTGSLDIVAGLRAARLRGRQQTNGGE